MQQMYSALALVLALALALARLIFFLALFATADSITQSQIHALGRRG
jgi:flagellar biogenesis protein FliO